MGIFKIAQYRDGRKIGERRAHNDHTTTGLRRLMVAAAYSIGTNQWPGYLDGNYSVTVWDVGFIDNDSFTGIDIADTMVLHPGWAEFAQARSQWFTSLVGYTSNPLPIESSAITSSVMTTAGDIVGMFIVSKTGRSNVLMATALFDAVLTVAVGDILEITYETSFQTPWGAAWPPD